MPTTAPGRGRSTLKTAGFSRLFKLPACKKIKISGQTFAKNRGSPMGLCPVFGKARLLFHRFFTKERIKPFVFFKASPVFLQKSRKNRAKIAEKRERNASCGCEKAGFPLLVHPFSTRFPQQIHRDFHRAGNAAGWAGAHCAPLQKGCAAAWGQAALRIPYCLLPGAWCLGYGGPSPWRTLCAATVGFLLPVAWCLLPLAIPGEMMYNQEKRGKEAHG